MTCQKADVFDIEQTVFGLLARIFSLDRNVDQTSILNIFEVIDLVKTANNMNNVNHNEHMLFVNE